MQVSVVGISHKTAPVAVREYFALSPQETPALLARLAADHAGVAVVSTCNRTEIYVTDPRPVDDPRPVVAALTAVKGGAPVDGAPFFALSGDEAARHLFRVSAGIESMVVGESEILGQVRAAFTAATGANTHTPALSRLFHTAIRVGRKVRDRTAIGQRPVSVSSTAVALARETLGDLADKTVLVIGAGEAGQLTAGNLLAGGIGRILVTSRTAERTAFLAESLAAHAVAFERRGDAIAQADIIISSTAAQEFVVDGAMIERAMAERPARPLLLIDIAVPRDIDPVTRHVSGVHLFDIDEVQAVAERNHDLRRQEIAAAEQIVEENVVKFAEWLQTLQTVPTVAALSERAEQLRLGELERTLAKTSMSAEDRARVEAMTASLVKKLLHAPISTLKRPDDGERYAAAARKLFGLDDDPESLDSEE
jgi:glutamyl-tRNA reductase